MAKIYLVDSENIGSSWSQLLGSMSDEDKMYVFYTDKSPYISYENLLQVIAHYHIPFFIKCFEGKNALDFQLVSELGFKLCEDPEQEFIIVSDDYGYDAAVRYWSGKKYNVRRIGKKYCRPMQPRRNEDAPAMQSEVVAVQIARNTDQENISEVVQNSDKTEEIEEKQATEVVQKLEAVQDTEAVQKPEKVEATEAMQKPEKAQNAEANLSMAQQQEIIKEQKEEQKTDSESVQDLETVQEQSPKRQKDRRRKRRKETAKESVNAEKTEKQDTEGAETAEVKKDTVKKVSAESNQSDVEAVDSPTKNTENSLEQQIVDMVKKCNSPEPEKDAQCVKEIFHTLAMGDLTTVNTALKILIGNELGNDIYRELKEHQECRAQLDALYYPAIKDRFNLYVQIVLDRSELQGITAEEAGNFLFRIPRKNLNSIRSAMLKEFGHELGSGIYTTFKPHIKVLNKI